MISRPITRAVLVVAVASSFAACGGTTEGASTPATSAGSSEGSGVEGSGADVAEGAGTTTTSTAGPAGSLTAQYGVRYCELLAVTLAEGGTTAEVWGTQGLNDCPDDAFAAIEATDVAAELGATVVVPNGPRFWVLDDIVANELAGSGEIRDFGGIEMRSIAFVDLGDGLPDRRPYGEVSVERDTEFAFAEGREIHELTAPDGSVYVMQSYSVEVAPELDASSLASLGDRLDLPQGWAFTSRVLDDRLVVEDIDGIATVVQDELHNSYQLRSRG